jgi:hypothetical protein
MTMTDEERLRRQVLNLFNEKVYELVDLLGVTEVQAQHYIYVHILLKEQNTNPKNIAKGLNI